MNPYSSVPTAYVGSLKTFLPSYFQNITRGVKEEFRI
jgi:hypothetical protein